MLSLFLVFFVFSSLLLSFLLFLSFSFVSLSVNSFSLSIPNLQSNLKW